MRSITLIGLTAAATVLAAIAGCAVRERGPAAEAPRSFPRELVAKGAELAHLGNCMGCHTAGNGKPYAGGAALKTPFGTVYGTNITPDPDTGIGRWPLEAFSRALREGVDIDGRHLYPAFPYDHYTLLTDEDIAALYAFVMTREAVHAQNRRNTVLVPRPFVALWKARYLKKGIFEPRADGSAEWNRGAYLVEGLGHCGACHTPRNALGAEKRDQAFSGAEVEGWHAPALNARSPSPVPWTLDAMQVYLRGGIAERHSVSAGPMAEVVHDLAQVSEEAVRAISSYVVSLDSRSEGERSRAREAALARARTAIAVKGNPVYDGACADCHNRGRGEEGGALELPLGVALALPTPRNLAYIIRDGIVPADGARGAWMPGFAGSLTDEQLAGLLDYLRSMSGEPAWPDTAGEVRKLSRDR